MNVLISEERFNFVSSENKLFIKAFDHEMTSLGYDFGGKIDSGFCWGKYMIIYRKTGVKSDNVYARIYIRDSSIVLRLFFSQIDKHRVYIENAPAHIKAVFSGPHGDCEHCKNDKDGKCKFRKTYTIDDRILEKCNGIVFEFQKPDLTKLEDFMALFKEFYPIKKSQR